MTNFREELFFGAHPGDRTQYRKVVLATNDTESHLNVYPNHGKVGSECMSISPAQARQLRDALLKAYPLEAAKPGKFKVGDKVRNKDGGTFSNGQRVVTLDRPCGAGSWWLKETNTRISTAFLELVSPAASTAPAEPAINTELGRFIVAKMDNGNYLPGTKPRVHTSAKSANDEATRLANDHGGTFHVLRASFEASRPVVVQPPVKTAKL